MLRDYFHLSLILLMLSKIGIFGSGLCVCLPKKLGVHVVSLSCGSEVNTANRKEILIKRFVWSVYENSLYKIFLLASFYFLK